MGKSITDQQRQQILSLRNKRTGREIAAMVGVSTAIVSLVLNDKHKPSADKPDETPPRPPRGETSPKKPTVARDVTAEVPDVVPEGADIALVDKWIKLIEDAANDARSDDNMSAFASLAAKLVSLLEHRRKVTPIPKADPNDNPDIIATGELVWKRLRKAFGLEK